MNDLIRDLLGAYVRSRPADIARAVGQSSPTVALDVVEHLSVEDQAVVIARLDRVRAGTILTALGAGGASVVAHLPGDRLITILRTVAREHHPALLAQLPASVLESVHRRLNLPASSAAFLVDPLIPAFGRGTPAGEALKSVREAGASGSYYIYVVDEAGALQGVCTLREVLLADAATPLAGLMRANPQSISLESSVDMVLRHPGWERAHTLPVLDGSTYVGAIRYRTLRDVTRRPDEMESGDWTETSRQLAEFLALGWTSLFVWGTGAVGLDEEKGR